MATGTGTDGGNPPCGTLPRINNDVQRAWSVTRDAEGHRTYKVTHRIQGDRDTDGPLAVLECPGLPEPGTIWDEGGMVDDWAFFSQEAEVVQVGKTTDNQYWDVTQVASTKPTVDCVTLGRQDPLTYPDRVNVETINYSQEQAFDRFGDLIVTSAWEQIRGPQVEFDAHRLQVTIEQNSAAMELDLVLSLMHHLNDGVMWGFPARTVKLSGFKAEPKYGPLCQKYFVRRFTFDVATDFDRCVLDEGTKVLRGAWDRDPISPTYGTYVIAKANPFNPLSVAPDPNNPRDFVRYKDWHGENSRAILNGHGVPWDPFNLTTGTADDNPGMNCIEYYSQGNLFLLGVPLSIE